MMTITMMTTSIMSVLLTCGWGAGVEERADDVTPAALQTLIQQQAAAMDSMRAEMTAMQSQISSVQSQMSSGLTAVRTDLSSVHSDLSSVHSDLDAVKHRVDKTVAFTARISNSQDSQAHGISLGHHQTIIFDDVVTNIGNGYNHNDGIFIAPVSGTYAFFLQMMSTNAHGGVKLAMVKNGNVLDAAWADGSSDEHDQGTSQVTTHLTAGDHVWVRQDWGDHIRASYWTVFTGYLLHAD